jgi:hypothetical protein
MESTDPNATGTGKECSVTNKWGERFMKMNYVGIEFLNGLAGSLGCRRT